MVMGSGIGFLEEEIIMVNSEICIRLIFVGMLVIDWAFGIGKGEKVGGSVELPVELTRAIHLEGVALGGRE